ncbi:MAG: hypothetical protein RR202_13240 [Bacteroidales bacterium]
MKLYTVSFISKKNPDEIFTPEDSYVGDNKDRAHEVAEEFRHNVKRFAAYAADYDVCVVDKTGAVLYSQPFVKVQEPEKQVGERREAWDKEKKSE